MPRINQNLVVFFKNLGLTQAEIADKLETNQANVSKILRGERNIGMIVAERIQKVYGLDMNDIIDINNTNQTKMIIMKPDEKPEKEWTKEELLDKVNELIKEVKELKGKNENLEVTIRNLNILINSLQNQQHTIVKANR